MLDLILFLFGIDAADALLFDSFLKNHAIINGCVLGGRGGVDVALLFFVFVVFMMKVCWRRLFFYL
jgi:hypothetical protein